MQAAVWRELMYWFREPRRAIELRVAILSAVFIALIPLFVGWDQLAPFMGAILVVMAAVVSSNSYGLEGSALWLTLMTPGAVRIDVRAKQWAFLALFGPLAALTMVVPVLVTGMHWTWPWLLSFVPAGLGSGAGVMILVAALHPVPVPAAARRSGNLMASGDTTGPAYITLLLVLLLSMPGLAVTGLGVQESSVPLQVAGVLLGSGIGALTFWWGGRRAIRKLETEGPEVLSLLRRGPPADTTADVADEPGTARLPVSAQVIVGICWTLAAIALFPQAIIPAVFKLTNRDDPVWFLPLHLPEPWQWPAIVAMLLIGGVFAIAALTISRRYETAKQPGR